MYPEISKTFMSSQIFMGDVPILSIIETNIEAGTELSHPSIEPYDRNLTGVVGFLAAALLIARSSFGFWAG